MKAFLIQVDEWIRSIESFLLWVLLGLIFVILTATVFFRYVVGSPLTWTEELLTILFTWMVFIGASSALTTHQHIRVDLMLRSVSDPVRHVMSALAVLICLGTFAITVWYGFAYVRRVWGDLTPMMGLTFGAFTLALPVTTLCAIVHLLRLWVEKGTVPALMSTIENATAEEAAK